MASDARAVSSCSSPDAGPPLSGRHPLCCPSPSAGLTISFDAEGKPSAFGVADGGALSPDIERCLRSFVGDYCYPSLAGTTQTFTSTCWVA
jgi:hypothetical protein